MVVAYAGETESKMVYFVPFNRLVRLGIGFVTSSSLIVTELFVVLAEHPISSVSIHRRHEGRKDLGYLI